MQFTLGEIVVQIMAFILIGVIIYKRRSDKEALKRTIITIITFIVILGILILISTLGGKIL